MSNVRAFLPKMGVNGYFILDTREGNMGDLVHTDKQFVTYNYNVRINNKIKPPCFFIYRIPGKARSDRKFKIIGGGVIEKITEPDENGYVDALVTHGFLLTRPIKQGDERVEGMKWTSKKKNSTKCSIRRRWYKKGGVEKSTPRLQVAGHDSRPKRRCEKIIHSAFISLASAGFHRLVTRD